MADVDPQDKKARDAITAGEIYYTILAKLAGGEVVKLAKPILWEGPPAPSCYIIAEANKNLSAALGFTLPSYVVGERDANDDKATVLHYYNPEEGKELIHRMVGLGWRQRVPTKAGAVDAPK